MTRRLLVAWLALLLWGRGVFAQEGAAQPGISFEYAGPAGNVFEALEKALGFVRLPGERWSGLSEQEAEKPIAVAVRGARLFDVLREVSAALGLWVDLENSWPHPRVSVRRDVTGATAPRASTPHFDIVLLGIERRASRSLGWGEDGVRMREHAPSYSLDLRLYPADLDAADRFVGLDGNRVVLRLPNGLEHAVAAMPSWASPEAPPLSRCVRQPYGTVPKEAMAAGELRVAGGVLVAREGPVSATANLAEDVGRALQAGPVQFRIVSWEPAGSRLRWVVEGFRAPEWWREDTKPTGVIWTELRAYGPYGVPLAAPSCAGWSEAGRLQMEMDYGPVQVARVEFRALVVEKEDDLEVEPFELTFTVPQAFLEG